MAQSPPIDGRGHNADKPSDIPKPGWRSILRRVYTSTSDKNLSVLAAGVAFYGMSPIPRQFSMRSIRLVD
jgi:membrane protein